jgi:transketolase
MKEVQFSAKDLRKALISLLEIKDSDIRIMILEQGRDAADRGIHIGGAMSATIPMVAVYYSGVLRFDVQEPTSPGQDLFVLSKGHAVATMASIYADLGFFDREVLKNSRSLESVLNGHPGPLLPGVHVSTGPEGHGLPVAQGLALAGRMQGASEMKFDVYCLTGDGELQAGMIWEAAMFAGAKGLDNLCVLVDKNEGQLDNPKALHFPLPNVGRRFESFGWRAFEVDATGYSSLVEALQEFKHGVRNGKPTVIVCNSRKGWGGFSSLMVAHKTQMVEEICAQELELQQARRLAREQALLESLAEMKAVDRDAVARLAKYMRLEIQQKPAAVTVVQEPPRTSRAPTRDKRVSYEVQRLPRIEPGTEIAASSVVTQAMKVFARSGMVVSVDADLGTTSGLEAGVGWVDTAKGLNVGVAESNMACVGEAFAVLGYNAWVSTFCPFFDWRVMRRIAINWQEREEVIRAGGWLSEGHNLDLVYLATAPNFDTRTNGATHMGNDDALVFSQIAHLKIVDLACPHLLLAFMKWIMEGGKGLVYARIPRAPTRSVYDPQVRFEYGKGYRLKSSSKDRACLVTSGRGIYEALAAADLLEKEGIPTGVIDMPSMDEELVTELYEGRAKVILAEQNNGILWQGFQKVLWKRFQNIESGRITAINALDAQGRPRFIHSATYEQLLESNGLSPRQLAGRVKKELQ